MPRRTEWYGNDVELLMFFFVVFYYHFSWFAKPSRSACKIPRKYYRLRWNIVEEEKKALNRRISWSEAQSDDSSLNGKMFNERLDAVRGTKQKKNTKLKESVYSVIKN